MRGYVYPNAFECMVGWILFLLFSLFLVASLSGCGVSADYVDADRQTYNAVSGSWLNYSSEDKSLTEKDVERRKRLVRSWEARIKAAEDE